jgi:protein gp37
MIPVWTDPVFYPDRITNPKLPSQPAIVFADSMSDLFGDWVDSEQIKQIISVCHQYPHHIFMFLTKNPARYLEFVFPENIFPENVMLGQTITHTDKNVYYAALTLIKNAGCKVFFSVEPMLGDVEPSQIDFADLIIVGADTSRGAKVPDRLAIDYAFGDRSPIAYDQVFYKENIRKYYPDLPKGNKEMIWKMFNK